jgi:hypothetical protein
MVTEFSDTSESPVGFLPATNNRIGFKLNIFSVVIHDPVEISAVPRLNPLLCERSHFGCRMRHFSPLDSGRLRQQPA